MKRTIKENKKEPIRPVPKPVSKPKTTINKIVKNESAPKQKAKTTSVTPTPKQKVIKILRWKKITNGTHSYKGKTIRKGEILECRIDEMSDIVKRHFVCLDKIPEEKDDGVVLKVQSTDDGKFNVINPKTNKPINEKTLTKTEAEKVIGKDIKE